MTDLTLFLHALAKASYLCGMVPFPVLLLGWLWWEERHRVKKARIIQFPSRQEKGKAA